MQRITSFFTFLLVTLSIYGNTYYVSKSGNDKNKGTKKAPFLTISKGATIAQPGDTVFVYEGIYRERVVPQRGGLPGKPIVYMGEPNKNVFIKGSDIWKPKWKKMTANVYFAVPDDKLFNDDCYKDNKNPFKVESATTPYQREGKAEVVNFGYKGDTTIVYTIGQVFVDGKMYIQRPLLKEMIDNEKSWFYDKSSGNIYIHFENDKPTTQQVEISTRRRIFAPHKRQLGYITVQGFILEHCGNQYPANFWESKHAEWQQAGAFGTRSGHHWVIKNNVIRFANGIGVDFGNEGESLTDLERGDNGRAYGAGFHTIDSNYITDNGAGGTAAYYPEHITFTNNVIERNVNLLFRGKKRWESAGVKMHGPNNSYIAHNLIRDNSGEWGMWLDQGAGKNTQVHANLIIGSDTGFDLEIGSAFPDKLILDNNIFINNKDAIGSRESGGISAINNLIIGAEKGFSNSINKDRAGDWSSSNQYYFNNVLLKCGLLATVCQPDFYRSSDRRFDYNLYNATESDKLFKIKYASTEPINFKTWKDRWRVFNNDTFSDQNSSLITDLNYELNTDALILKLTIPDEYLMAKSLPYQKVDTDFFGQSLPKDGSALPGPFQRLTKGENVINIWNGMKPLAIYELPFK